jgi:hypothetical protein
VVKFHYIFYALVSVRGFSKKCQPYFFADLLDAVFFLVVAFLADDFLAVAFLADDFLAVVFLAVVFLAVVFLAVAAGAFAVLFASLTSFFSAVVICLSKALLLS